MPRRIVLFGASGFTGRLVAKALVRANVRPVLAGRNHQSLAALGVSLGKGLDIAVADARRPESLLALVQPGDVLLSTVGPYVRYGRSVVEVAIYRHATYVDVCAEPAFIRTVFDELDVLAKPAGVALLPAFGYEYVAGNLAAALVLSSLEGSASKVEVGYFYRGPHRRAISVGTRGSAGAAAFSPSHAWRAGAVQTVHAGDRVRAFQVDGRPRPGLAIGGAEHMVVPRLAPGIQEVGVYVGGPRSRFAARLTSALLTGVAYIPSLARAAGSLSRLPAATQGPAPELRERTSTEVVARSFDGGGLESRTVRLRGEYPYAFTAAIMAWAAERISRDDISGVGALGPVEAFGLGPLRDACAAAGLTVVED